MTKLKKFFYEFLKYFFFFVLFYLLSVAEVEGLRPFAFGMLFALVWCNQKIYIVSPLYILSGLTVELSVSNLISLVVCVGVFVLFYLLHLKLKKPLNPVLIGIYAFLSQFAYLYINSISAETFIKAIITVFIGLICMYAYLYFMQSLIVRGLRRRYMLDEVISAGVLLIAVGVGLVCIPDFEGIVSKTVLIFLVLMFVWMFSTGVSISFSVVLALGAILGSHNLSLFVSLALASVVANLTKSNKRIFACLSVVLIDIFVNLYFFSFFNAYMLLASFLGTLLFVLIPNKTLNKLSNFVISENDDFALRNIINRSRNNLYKRVCQTSEVFLEMQNVFMSMAKGSLSPDETVNFLTTEVKKQNCEKCVRKNECLRLNLQETDKAISNLVALSLARGKVNVLDVPSTLSANCEKLSILISSINSLAKEYSENAQISMQMDNSRVLIANQLFGVSQILKSLANEVNLNITFDITKERQIMEELLYVNILCTEAVVYFKDKEIKNVTLIVRKGDEKSIEIEKIISRVLNTKMEIASISPAEKGGFVCVTLKMFVPYDIIFGSSGVNKNGSSISGDTHSVLRVCEGKVLMALCDGMGSGKLAEKVSNLALTLIENFYKAGFESSLILSNVNKLLSMKEEENFSALDICVFDLQKCYCDLVKLGSPVGFVKKKDKIVVIEAGALPLGILENVKPSVSSYALSDDDMVILITDGVLDAFGSFEELKNFINDQQETNPQMLADQIIAEGLLHSGNFAPDDMTVLVGKVWQKV